MRTGRLATHPQLLESVRNLRDPHDQRAQGGAGRHATHKCAVPIPPDPARPKALRPIYSPASNGHGGHFAYQATNGKPKVVDWALGRSRQTSAGGSDDPAPAMQEDGQAPHPPVPIACLDRRDPFSQWTLAAKQAATGLLQRRDLRRRESRRLGAYKIQRDQARAVILDQAISSKILGDDGASRDESKGFDSHMLANGGQSAELRHVPDFDMTAQGRGVRGQSRGSHG